jgi:hypothetical protein
MEGSADLGTRAEPTSALPKDGLSMTRISESRKAVLDRLEIVVAYLSTNMAVTSFTELFNTGGIYRPLFTETGPVDAEDLDRWTDICMKVTEEEEDD